VLFTCIGVAVSSGAFAAATAPLPAMIRVNGGIIEYRTDELYINPFSIARESVADESRFSADCEYPTVGEYLLAAKLPGFTVSQTFEFVQTPPEDACTWNREFLQAEGVDGNVHFAGIGSQVPGELTFESGGVDPRNSISKIHTNIYLITNETQPTL